MIMIFSPFDDDNSKVNEYAMLRGANAKAFIAPHVYQNGTTQGTVENPGGMSAAGTDWVVIYDLKGDSYRDHSHGLRVASYNYMASTYSVNSQDTPGISEYRDFFIQQGRIDETAYSATTYAYAGRLNKEEKLQSYSCFGCGEHLPMIAQIHLPNLAGYKCVAIANNSISDRAEMVISNCNSLSSNQWFSFVDAAIDYGSSPKTPSSRGYIIQPVNRSGTLPNEKVVEVQGHCCGNNGANRRIFQYGREGTTTTNRSEDQHWKVSFGTFPNILLSPSHDLNVCFQQSESIFAETNTCSHANSEQAIELLPVSLY